MNRINPNKLLMSKWTASNPVKKERHFIVTKLIEDSDENIVACELQAVINKHIYQKNWQELKDPDHWLMGWK